MCAFKIIFMFFLIQLPILCVNEVYSTKNKLIETHIIMEPSFRISMSDLKLSAIFSNMHI